MKRPPDSMIAAGRVSTQASAILRMVLACSPEPFADRTASTAPPDKPMITDPPVLLIFFSQ